MGRSEIVNVAGLAGEERLEFVLEVAIHPFTIEVLEPGHLASTISGRDVRECFDALRRQLEDHGILLCCMGSRPDVWSSGMLHQFSDGREAYLHREGEKATNDDVVDIFAPTDASEVVTLEEQRAAFLDAHPILKERLIAKGAVPAPGTAPSSSAEDQQDSL
ncbi:hypothetical protein SK854_26320 [Lentzea sp. BCCO 10_0061]|uniref:Uncharacterized protein n=1 Tax=Lentzea sokolovensis TaxID=3095429 RepID=A0ABU4V3V7_9PSEU|nr:hypothetical protein [Lentzea sp. BCCO 10_0061]MDX8145653.1 hypothetical protein [Lentzea sp. BCCO 10_0061]